MYVYIYPPSPIPCPPHVQALRTAPSPKAAPAVAHCASEIPPQASRTAPGATGKGGPGQRGQVGGAAVVGASGIHENLT